MKFSRSLTTIVLVASFAGAALRLAAQTDQTIYTDSLVNGWVNYSWATVNLANTSPVHSGSQSISVTCTNYTALYLHAPAFNSSGYTNLTFWINGGATGGQPLQVEATLNGTAQPPVTLSALTTNWQQITISLTALGVANASTMDGFWIQNRNNGNIPTFYVDDISLVAGAVVTNIAAPISINATANQHTISPQIYGTAFATSNQLSDLNFTMNRSGGNNETRYNWLTNAHNIDADYYFESYPDSSSVPGATADAFVANGKNGGAQPMITVPMIGWSPMLGSNRSILYSYAVTNYGPQTSVDQYLTNAGNGISVTNNTPITWNNPNDANFPTTVAFQQDYVRHLMTNWGASTNGGVGYYLMDNEHSIWFSTHQDVHPIGPTMQEIWTKMLATAQMVKSNDPSALVLGPEEWGWSGYLDSGYDQQWSKLHNDSNPAHLPDRTTNGGWDYMPWLLNQFHQYQQTNGQRLLDYFTLHCYPQEGTVGSATDVSQSTELLRNASTRQFWDTNYVDPSWINSVIMLIPRMSNWVATYYPGTKLGVTEYNWGAENYISGATAQADLLGIFGWQGLDLATRWTTPTNTSPTYKAMKMYRNYDGNKSIFGNTSVSCSGPNPDNVSAFAALRSADGALTVMVINKQLTATATATVAVTNFSAGSVAQQWQLTSANHITRLADVAVTGNSFSNLLPAQSITLFILPAAVPSAPVLTAGTLSSSNTFDIWLNGQASQSYIIQSSTNLSGWLPVSTNRLASNSLHLFLQTTNAPVQFYRAVWAP